MPPAGGKRASQPPARVRARHARHLSRASGCCARCRDDRRAGILEHDRRGCRDARRRLAQDLLPALRRQAGVPPGHLRRDRGRLHGCGRERLPRGPGPIPARGGGTQSAVRESFGRPRRHAHRDDRDRRRRRGGNRTPREADQQLRSVPAQEPGPGPAPRHDRQPDPAGDRGRSCQGHVHAYAERRAGRPPAARGRPRRAGSPPTRWSRR